MPYSSDGVLTTAELTALTHALRDAASSVGAFGSTAYPTSSPDPAEYDAQLAGSVSGLTDQLRGTQLSALDNDVWPRDGGGEHVTAMPPPPPPHVDSSSRGPPRQHGRHDSGTSPSVYDSRTKSSMFSAVARRELTGSHRVDERGVPTSLTGLEQKVHALRRLQQEGQLILSERRTELKRMELDYARQVDIVGELARAVLLLAEERREAATAGATGGGNAPAMSLAELDGIIWQFRRQLLLPPMPSALPQAQQQELQALSPPASSSPRARYGEHTLIDVVRMSAGLPPTAPPAADASLATARQLLRAEQSLPNIRALEAAMAATSTAVTPSSQAQAPLPVSNARTLPTQTSLASASLYFERSDASGMRAMEREAAAAAATAAAAEQPVLSNSSVRTAPPPPPPRAQGPQLRTLVNRGTGEAVHAASDGDDCLQPQRPAVDGAAAAAAPPAVMPAARHAPGVRLVASEVAAVQPAVLASAAPPSRSWMLQMAVQSAQRVMPPAIARGDAAPHGQVQT